MSLDAVGYGHDVLPSESEVPEYLFIMICQYQSRWVLSLWIRFLLSIRLSQSKRTRLSSHFYPAFRCLNVENRMNKFKAAVLKNILTESTAVLNRWTAVAYTTTNSIQTLAYSRVTSPPHKKLKACLCRGKRLKRLCAIREQESLQEWTTFPLRYLRMEARQQQQSWLWHARRYRRRRNGRRSGHNRSSYLYHRKATSSNVRTIVPSA